jgi:hypothetical protein
MEATWGMDAYHQHTDSKADEHKIAEKKNVSTKNCRLIASNQGKQRRLWNQIVPVGRTRKELTLAAFPLLGRAPATPVPQVRPVLP